MINGGSESGSRDANASLDWPGVRFATGPQAVGTPGSVAAPSTATRPMRLVAVFLGADPPRRARLLEALLPAVRPMALVVLGDGVLSKYLWRPSWRHVNVAVADAQRVGAAQMLGIARYVAQCEPDLIDRLCERFAASPAPGDR